MAENRTRRRSDRQRDERSQDDPAREDGRRDARSRDNRRSDNRRRAASRPDGSDKGKAQSDGAAEEPRAMDSSEVARRAIEQVVDLTGRDADGVTSLQRTDDGWLVGVEIVETRRIPDSADILAIYEVELDGAGRLVAYHRDLRYLRSQVDRDRS